MKKLNIEDIPCDFREVHGNNYDYSFYRISVTGAFKVKNFNTGTKPSRLLGCEWDTFKAHLEDNPYGFKVGDEGLDLDHIIPLAKSETEEQVIKLFNYKNYQLLPSYYNRHIKRCKPFDEKDFNNWLNNK